ncbi:ABC transporter permease [Flavitalea sp.]|nr:ABC transporter permease [Flavitalea sp.]
MFRNYLIVAFRNLMRHKGYSAINLMGLGTGLAVCMLIVLYVQHESTFDSFHRNGERTYWIRTKIYNGNDSIYMNRMNYAAAALVKQSNPGVESFMRFMKADNNTIIQNPRNPSLKFSEDKFLFADSNFFSFFTFKLLQGDKFQALKDPFTVVISRETAEKYFGDVQNAMGKIIRYNNTHDFTVTGVAQNAPSNSSIDYSFVAAVSSLSAIQDKKGLVASQKIETGPFSTYFLLRDAGKASQLQTNLLQLYRNTNKNGKDNKRYIAIPLTETHLMINYGGTSSVKYLKIFPFVAALILLLALTNYMSLSTARSATRIKEIGVRKVMGAMRSTIATQFFVESALYTLIAFSAGYILCIAFQPLFFSFLQIDIDDNFLYHPYLLLSFLGLFIISVLLSGSYPSFLLSAYKPVMVLYGKFNKQSTGISMRKFFTVFQFAISVILIVCTIVIGKQLHFFKNTYTGIDQENIVFIPFSPAAGKHFNTFKKETSNLAAVKEVTASRYPLYDGYDMFSTKIKNKDEDATLVLLTVDENFISLLGLQWKNPPTNNLYNQMQNAVILNESAVEKLNLTAAKAINEKINIWDTEHQVGGVLKDFNYESLHDKIDGACLVISKDTASAWGDSGGCLFAKLQAGANIPAAIKQLKSLYEKYDKDTPFQYYFMDDAYETMYKAEDRIFSIFNVFTVITVLIACLGLVGLSIFTAEQRRKEIGIRKVLGASIMGVVSLLLNDFLKLVLVAIVIASPVAWYFTNEWLNDFAYRTTISWWIFALATLTTVFIALATISFQSVRAALMNPVKSLSSE